MLNSRLIIGLQSNKLLKSVCIYKNLPAVKHASDWVPKEQVTHTGQVIFLRITRYESNFHLKGNSLRFSNGIAMIID